MIMILVTILFPNLIATLVWVDFDLGVLPSCFCQIPIGRGKSGRQWNTQNKVNPTQVVLDTQYMCWSPSFVEFSNFQVLSILSKSVEEARSESVVLSLFFVGLGVAMGIGVFLQAFIYPILLKNNYHIFGNLPSTLRILSRSACFHLSVKD